ncbi:MAG: hypothetical protein AAB074_03230 [Planctomycetota bacterium]
MSLRSGASSRPHRRAVRLLALLEAIDTPEAREAAARLVQPNLSLALRRAAGDAVRRQKR